VNVVVRLHPNEDGSLYRNCSHLTITKGSPDLAVMLEGSDWVGSRAPPSCTMPCFTETCLAVLCRRMV
jgi:hypothetical protein